MAGIAVVGSIAVVDVVAFWPDGISPGSAGTPGPAGAFSGEKDLQHDQKRDTDDQNEHVRAEGAGPI